jgi:hypothetical protein
MKNEDVVILVGPENSIFYCYTESEFQRILNEKPPFVLQGERKPVAMQRQDDPKRTFWVYNTYFGYVDKSLYDYYMAGVRTFKIVPSDLGYQVIFKNPGIEIGSVHDYSARISSAIPVNREKLLSGKGDIQENIPRNPDQKQQEIKEVQDLLPDDVDDLIPEDEIEEFLNKMEKEQESILAEKRENRKRDDEEIRRIVSQRSENWKTRIEEQKQRDGYTEAKDEENPSRIFRISALANREGQRMGAESHVVIPEGTEEFDCSGNSEVKTLGPLPGTLKKLNCQNCTKLERLPDLPASLEELKCDSTNLEKLPNLPGSLKFLNCSRMQSLANLPALPNGLEILVCTDCPMLRGLPDLPNSLAVLDCSECKVVSLPVLPESLRVLECGKCPVRTLPELSQTSLTKIVCSECKNLTGLSALPDTLNSLVCEFCENLETLPNLPDGLRVLNCDYCVKLRRLPVLPDGIRISYRGCVRLENPPVDEDSGEDETE